MDGLGKGYELTLEHRENYLYVFVSGEKLSAQIAGRYWNEIAGECFEKGYKAILLEKDFRESVGPEDMLLMAEHLGNLLPGCRVALVDRHRHEDINRLGNKLARNRDVIMQVFDDVADAQEWLSTDQ